MEFLRQANPQPILRVGPDDAQPGFPLVGRQRGHGRAAGVGHRGLQEFLPQHPLVHFIGARDDVPVGRDVAVRVDDEPAARLVDRIRGHRSRRTRTAAEGQLRAHLAADQDDARLRAQDGSLKLRLAGGGGDWRPEQEECDPRRQK